MSPHGALRAYTVLLTVEPLRGSPMSHILQYRYSPHISDVREWRYSVTAWRTSCLYGASHSSTSPTYTDGVTSLLSSGKGEKGGVRTRQQGQSG